MFVFVFQMLLIICSTKPKSARLVPGKSSHSSNSQNPVLRRNSSREERHHHQHHHSHSGAHPKTTTTRRSSQSSQKPEQQLHKRRSSRSSMTEEDYKAKMAYYKERAAQRNAQRASRAKDLCKLESSTLGTNIAAEQLQGTTGRLLEKYKNQNERMSIKVPSGLMFDTKKAQRRAERLVKRVEKTVGIKILKEPTMMERSQEMYEAAQELCKEAQEEVVKIGQDIKQGTNHMLGIKTPIEKDRELREQMRKKYMEKYSN